VVRHGILPALTALIMLLPVYGQLNPAPDYPNNLAIWLLVAWMVVGAVYLGYLHRRRPALIGAMGKAFEDTAAPASARPEGATPAA
jgi:hypothetical protein